MRGETVVRVRAALVYDAYSEQSTMRDWSTIDSLDIDGCAFAPGGTSEPLEAARTSVVVQPTVYAPAGADITASDRLEVRGVTYEVDGQPGDWRSPFTGLAAGLVVTLKDVEG